MIRENKSIDVPAVIKYFGGKHKIVADYETYLGVVISIKTVEKWIERKALSIKNIMNLKSIADHCNMKFKIEEFIK